MVPILFIKIKNAINYFFTSIILFLIKLGSRKEKKGTLLLIRLDFIGDYILFRNFLGIIRNSAKYKNYNITLCGNIAWKDLAETFDKKVVNRFIWIDNKKFYRNLFYKYRVLNRIYKLGFETVIEATHSRAILYGDTIVNASKARIRIGSEGSGEKHVVWKRKLFTDKLYSSLIKISDNNLFEFEINRELFNSLLGEEINITKPDLDTSMLQQSEKIKNRYVLLFPGASQHNKKWSSKNFKEVAEFVIDNFPFNIALSGSKNESYLFDEIVPVNSGNRFLNFFGNTLAELSKLIAEAKLLISNETSAIHIAAAVNTPFICISNGSHFGRFHPYPKEIFEEAYFIYPTEIVNKINDIKGLSEQYRFGSDLNINQIKPETVIPVIKKLLTKFEV